MLERENLPKLCDEIIPLIVSAVINAAAHEDWVKVSY